MDLSKVVVAVRQGIKRRFQVGVSSGQSLATDPDGTVAITDATFNFVVFETIGNHELHVLFVVGIVMVVTIVEWIVVVVLVVVVVGFVLWEISVLQVTFRRPRPTTFVKGVGSLGGGCPAFDQSIVPVSVVRWNNGLGWGFLCSKRGMSGGSDLGFCGSFSVGPAIFCFEDMDNIGVGRDSRV